jgi:hypothetical protein
VRHVDAALRIVALLLNLFIMLCVTVVVQVLEL